MSDRKPPTAAQREARKAFKEIKINRALSEDQIKDRAFSENRERLKAERLAREAKETGK